MLLDHRSTPFNPRAYDSRSVIGFQKFTELRIHIDFYVFIYLFREAKKRVFLAAELVNID
jgi:hypothetical protein